MLYRAPSCVKIGTYHLLLPCDGGGDDDGDGGDGDASARRWRATLARI